MINADDTLMVIDGSYNERRGQFRLIYDHNSKCDMLMQQKYSNGPMVH